MITMTPQPQIRVAVVTLRICIERYLWYIHQIEYILTYIGYFRCHKMDKVFHLTETDVAINLISCMYLYPLFRNQK